jgi:mRNA interferase RelE/StbE
VTWTVRFTAEAERQGDALDPQIRRRVTGALRRLAADPRAASNIKAMQGSDRYRLRVGDWRVIYSLHDDVLLVLVLRIGHRREVYR